MSEVNLSIAGVLYMPNAIEQPDGYLGSLDILTPSTLKPQLYGLMVHVVTKCSYTFASVSDRKVLKCKIILVVTG